MQIITHRGLEPRNKHFSYLESTKEAFQNHLERGYGVEFDINFSSDDICFIFHDNNLSRVTEEGTKCITKNLSWEQIKNLKLIKNGTLLTLRELLLLIKQTRKDGEYSALHLKSRYQEKKYIDIILSIIQDISLLENKLFIFDIKIETAKYIKALFPKLKLFPSVAHIYDIKRFNKYTGGTLLSSEEVYTHKEYFDGVWLDEWDTEDKDGKRKIFYNSSVLQKFRDIGFSIGLVTPELHNTTPGLLAGETHKDGTNIELWKLRINEIKKLNPDYICCDYLDLI